MKEAGIERKKFIFKDLPSYTRWILDNKLTEFVVLGIRYSREEELPLLKPLSKFSDEELVAMSIEQYRVTLQALSENRIAPHIEESIQRWADNKLEIIDKDEIGLEDFALVAFIKRKMYRSLLEEYTTDRELMKRLMNEIDMYTSEEELVGYKAYISMQQDKVRNQESLLQETNELYKVAQEITHLGSWSWDIVSNKMLWSDEMYRIYGLAPQSEEITFDRYISLIHPAYRENRIAEIRHSLKTQEAPNYTLRIVTPAGDEKALKGRGWVETNQKNETVRLHGTCQDITREYEMNRELVTLNETLSKKNFELQLINKELESFNYIASHDMQEPLRKIHVYVHRLLEDEEHVTEKGKEYIQKAIASVTRMQKLITDLIIFSQATSLNTSFERTELNKVIEDVRHSLSDQFEETKAKLHVDPLPHINAIPFQLNQLFTNIIGNAIKYRKEDAEPEISISSMLVDGRELNNPNASAPGYLQILVTDNGIGFEPEQKEKIFDLFTRLHPKNQYSGTGIGLSICKKIVQHHNGFIEAESEKGKGSTFRILLPASSLLKLN